MMYFQGNCTGLFQGLTVIIYSAYLCMFLGFFSSLPPHKYKEKLDKTGALSF